MSLAEIKKQFEESKDDKSKAELFTQMIKILDDKKQAQKNSYKKYKSTEKGKMAQKKANANYWAKKRSGKPRGRPKKESAKL